MMHPLFSLMRRLQRNRRGATLMEFGLIAGPLILTIMAICDLGYQSYLRSVARGVLERAARSASVGTLNGDQIDAYVKEQMSTIAAKNSEDPQIVKKSYYDFSRVNKPEKITEDTAPLGTYNVGDCYEDANNNNNYDTNSGSTGLGGADDIIYYEVTIRMPRLFPMAKILGWSETQSVTATTMLRNQPWANQETPVERCS